MENVGLMTLCSGGAALAITLILAAPTRAAPATIPAQLFERAALVYSHAGGIALDYRVTSDNLAAIPLDESGQIRWRKPDFYAQTFH